MKRLAEQPINPDDMTAWCGACQLDIKGHYNWIKHLESKEHLSKIEKLVESKVETTNQFTQSDSPQPKKGIKIGIGFVIVITALALLLSLGNSQYFVDENILEFLNPIITGVGESQDEIQTTIDDVIKETQLTVEKKTSGGKLEYNPSKIEQLVHDLTNEKRRINGLDTLRLVPEISDIARSHSLDMANHNYFAHENLDGLDASDRAELAGFRCFKMVNNLMYFGLAENIFRNNLYDSVQLLNGVPISYNWNTMEEISQSTVDGWMDSEGHRKNILTSRFDREGIGVVISSDDKVYITQNLC